MKEGSLRETWTLVGGVLERVLTRVWQVADIWDLNKAD